MTEYGDNFAEWVANEGLTQPFVDRGTFLRNFQLCCVAKGQRRKRMIVSMDKGLGKTLTAFTIFESLGPLPPGFTVVIFTTERGMEAYRRDWEKLLKGQQEQVQLVYGNKQQRGSRWRNNVARYFICTYAGFLSDTGNMRLKEESSESIVPQWVMNNQIDGVVCDEFHRVFRRKDSTTFKVFKRLFRDTQYFFPFSGSAINKSPTDLWAALHLCDPKFWSTYWGYAYTWCEVEDGHFGKKIGGPKRDRVAKWREAVRPYVFHVSKEMVKDEMPPILRETLDVKMGSEQRKLHDSLKNQLYAELPDGEFIFAPNTLSAHYKARLAMICPKSLDPTLGYGIGIESIWDDAQESELSRYAIFTPFKLPIPHLVEYLKSKGASVGVLQGGIGLDEQELRLAEWRRSLESASGERPSVILSTIKYGESWEIPEASYGYMLGYEWSAEDNKQAEARLCRLISPGPVYIQYVHHLGAYDEEHLARLIEQADDRQAMLNDWYEGGKK
jgi:hypothetical protein